MRGCRIPSGQCRPFYEALDGAVFPVFSVEHGKSAVKSCKRRPFRTEFYQPVDCTIRHDICRRAVFFVLLPCICFDIFRITIVPEPSSVFCDAYGYDIVFITVYVGKDGIARAGNKIFAGAAAKKNGYFFLSIYTPFECGYFRFSGLSPLGSSTMKMPSLRISTSSKYISPSMYSGR